MHGMSAFHWFRLFLSAIQMIGSFSVSISKKRKTAKRLKFLKEKLRPRIIENSSYEDQGKQSCEPETREVILREIISWIDNVLEGSECFYWLSGGPGVGKSTVAASIAKYCVDHNILGAQFFINRDDAATTDPRILFPTICYQLCQHFPQTVAVVMEEILLTPPTLTDDISEDQATKLFVKAVDAAAATDRSRAVVVVIDALDETDPNRLWDLAQILSGVVAGLPQNAKVFLSSRNENAITAPFDALRGHQRVIFRSLVSDQSIEEVSQFMEKKVRRILREYGIDWNKWGDDRMKKFSSQASGLYIWAQTALKLLRAEIRNKGTACFDELLNMLATKNMHNINNLYLGILRRTCESGDWEYERFRRIVGAIVVCQTPLSIDDMKKLLDLRERESSELVDLVHFVRQYRTVLVDNVNLEEINGLIVPRMHKSFVDFVTSEWAQEFRVDKSLSHGELALQCMEQLDDLISYLDGQLHLTAPLFPAQLSYASRYWQTHLTGVVEPDMDNVIEEKNEYNIQLEKENDTGGLAVLQADSFGKQDLKPEIENTRWSLLAFSPDGTRIASSYGEGVIQLWDTGTGLKVGASLMGHGDVITNIAFSPDGTQIVSASWDKTARIWDTRTGRVLHTLRGHTDEVDFAGFSNDGRTVVTYSQDGTLYSWSAPTGKLLKEFSGHLGRLLYCTFSPNGQRMATLSFNGDIHVWDLNSGNLISEIEHLGGCYLIAFCPCSDHIISRGSYGSLIWNTEFGDHADHANFVDGRLAFTEYDSSSYIDVPPALKHYDRSAPQVCYLKTQGGTVWGVVEHGQGVWISLNDNRKLHFAAGATGKYNF